MKRILFYLLILAAVLYAPVRGTDVGKLRPVQAISLYKEKGQCIIETDTEDRGVGKTGMEALDNLKQTTPAKIYLDTADFLLLGERVEEELEQLREKLKASVKLCKMEENINPRQAAEFLKVHKNLPSLKVWKIGDYMPIIKHFGERLILLQKYEK